MSQENVEIVQGLYAALNREDLDEVLKHLAPDFEFDWSRAVGPRQGVYRLDRARPARLPRRTARRCGAGRRGP